jgi:hypothetical protein
MQVRECKAWRIHGGHPFSPARMIRRVGVNEHGPLDQSVVLLVQFRVFRVIFPSVH